MNKDLSRRDFLKLSGLAALGAAAATCGFGDQLPPPAAKGQLLSPEGSSLTEAVVNKDLLYKKFISVEKEQSVINPEAVNEKGWEIIYNKIHVFVKRFHEKSPEKDTKTLNEYEEEFYDKVLHTCRSMGVDFTVCLKLMSKAPGDPDSDAVVEFIRKNDFLGFLADKTDIITPMQAIRMFNGNPSSGLLDAEQIIHARVAEAYPTEMASLLEEYSDVAKSWTSLIEVRNAQDSLQIDLQNAINDYLSQYPNSLDFFWEEATVDSNFAKLGIEPKTVSSEQLLNYGVAWLKWSELYDRDRDNEQFFENVATETKIFFTSSNDKNKTLFEDQILKGETLVKMIKERAGTDDEKQLLDRILGLRSDYLDQTKKFVTADDSTYDAEHRYDDDPNYQIGLSVALIKHYSRITQDRFVFSIDSSKPETVWSAIYMNMTILEVSSAGILASVRLNTPSHAQYDWDATLSSLSSLIQIMGVQPLSSKEGFLSFYRGLLELASGISENPAAQDLYNRLTIPSGSTGWHFALEAVKELNLL